MTDSKIINDLNGFLDDDKISKKLILMSLYISMFELVNYQVLNTPKNFFSSDVRLINGKLVACDESPDYIENVKKHFKKDLFKSSAYWYQINNIIDEDDFNLLVSFRDNRNNAAHEIINILFDSSFSVQHDEFEKVSNIHKKICMWWIKEVESTTNPAFDNINLETFDFESAIETQLFPVKRLVDLFNKLIK